MADDQDMEDISIDKNDIQHLYMCERKLMQQKKWIQNALKKINEQSIALMVENMAMTNILNEETRKLHKEKVMEDIDSPSVSSSVGSVKTPSSVQPNSCSTEEMDSVKSYMNTKTLDLSVDNLLDDIIKTQKENEAETESEEEVEKDISFSEF